MPRMGDRKCVGSRIICPIYRKDQTRVRASLKTKKKLVERETWPASASVSSKGGRVLW